MRWIVLFAFWTTALSSVWTTGSWSLLAAQAQEQAWESYSMAVVDLGDGPGGPGPPPYFSTKMRPKGSKKIWGETGPPPPLHPLSEGQDLPLLWYIWPKHRHNCMHINQNFFVTCASIFSCFNVVALVVIFKLSCQYFFLQRTNANLHHVTKFPLYLSFTVHYFYT